MPLAVLSVYTCVQWVKFGCIAYEFGDVHG